MSICSAETSVGVVQFMLCCCQKIIYVGINSCVCVFQDRLGHVEKQLSQTITQLAETSVQLSSALEKQEGGKERSLCIIVVRITTSAA